MEHRTIGGFKVSVLGLGTSRLASLGAGRSLPEVRRLLDTAAGLGVTFIDTADTYGSTQCERWLGEALRGRGECFVIATKCGLPTVDLPRPFRALNQPSKKIVQRFGPQHYLDPAHIRRSIDSSLGRMRRERLELYFIHQPPVGVENMEEIFEALGQARSAGKIGAYGVCSQDPGIIRAVVSADRCDVVQTWVDPLGTSRLMATLASVPARDRVEIVANNVLTGLMRPAVTGAGEGARAAADLGRKLEALSAERGVSKVHLMVRHAAAVSNVRVVLTGTSNPVHLAENVAALDLPVTQEDLLL